MSEVKVNKISPRTNCGTVQLGDSGDTITIPAGATITNNGTQTGFGRTGTVDWNTTKKTASFTATSGDGFFIDTSGGAITMTLPASPSAGDIVSFKDYANTFDTNNLTIGRNSQPISGETSDQVVSVEGQSGTLIYVDATKGWMIVNASTDADLPVAKFVAATGGTITTSGNFKIHTFTGPGTFTVTCAGNSGGSNSVDYLVIAGGASGGGGGTGVGGGGGGGGAGGYRESSGTASGCYTRSPLGACVSALTLPATAYPVTVGAGGAAQTTPDTNGNSGNNSVFSTITSTGGGGGGGGRNACSTSSSRPGVSGGSGGGAGGTACRPEGTGLGSGGSGNTPPVSPPQGKQGGNVGPSAPNRQGASGGGATAGAAPYNCGVSTDAKAGGAGATSSITASPVARAGGGGGGAGAAPATAAPVDGGGKGGFANCTVATAGTANTGGGGGGGGDASAVDGAAGGSGLVVIRYKFQ